MWHQFSIAALFLHILHFCDSSIEIRSVALACPSDSKTFKLIIQFIHTEFSSSNVNILYGNRLDKCENYRRLFHAELWEFTSATVSYSNIETDRIKRNGNFHEYLIGFHLHQFTPWTEVNLVILPDGILATENVEKFLHIHDFERARSFNIFWQLDHRNENLLEMKELDHLKYKIELVPSDIEDVPPMRVIQVDVWSRCFYCNAGNPATIYVTSLEITSRGPRSTPSRHELFKDHTKDFYGKILLVALTKGMPEMMSFKTLKYDRGNRAVVNGGFQGKLFLMVKKKLNFGYNITLEDTFGVRGEGGKFSGMVGAVQSGRADVGVGATATQGRYQVVHFLTPNTFELVTFITRNPQPRPQWQMIFIAFTLPIWFMALCVACLMVYPTFVVANTLAERANQPKLFHIGINGVGFIFRSIFDQAWSKDRAFQYTAVRLLASAWLIAALFIGTEVKCNLMKLAVSPPLETVPSTFTQLANSDYEIITHYAGGSLNRILSTTHTPTFDKISQKMRPEKSIRKCLEDAIKSHAACISYQDDAIIEGQRNFADSYGHLHIHHAQMSAFNFYASIILPKDAVYIESMETTVSHIVDQGLVKRFHDEQYSRVRLKGRRWARRRRNQSAQVPSYLQDVRQHHYESLTIKHFLPPFIVLTLGVGASLIARIVEASKFGKVKVESFELEEQAVETAEDTQGLVMGHARRRRSSVAASIPYLLPATYLTPSPNT